MKIDYKYLSAITLAAIGIVLLLNHTNSAMSNFGGGFCIGYALFLSRKSGEGKGKSL